MNLNHLRVLVTRPAQQAQPLLDAIAQAGGRAVSFPLLEIRLLHGKQILMAVTPLDQFDAIICISRHAAQALIDCCKEHDISLPQTVVWFTPGAGTAEVLAAAGIQAQWPQALGTSEALLSLPWFAKAAGKKVLICKGVGGREWLKDSLMSQGATVECVELYERIATQSDTGELDQCLLAHNINIILVNNGETLTQLMQRSESRGIYSQALVVPSERVADMARQNGFQTVWCANGAGVEAVMQCLDEHASSVKG